MKFPTPALFVLAIAVLIALTAGGNTRADQSRGRVLAEQRCSHCHGVKRGEKSPAADAPSFTDVAAEPSISEYMLRVFLQTPHPTMPNLIIKPDEIDDIVSYIGSLKPKH